MDPIGPLLLAPVYKDYPWGGSRIPERYGRTGTPEICAESWEISAHADGMGVVTHGKYAGRSLAALVAEHPAAVLGHRTSEASFPLLFKLIDARGALSVQVHPSNATAGLSGGDPKTEMWVVLDAAPGAGVYAGLRPGVTRDTFETALKDGDLEAVLCFLPVVPGQAVFIPGGLVHAIGAGCLLMEVQQNSNTTYRVYDWNRRGNDGKPRELHIAQALEVIGWNLSPASAVSPVMRSIQPGLRCGKLVACEFFDTERLELSQETAFCNGGAGFHALFVVSGQVTLESAHPTVVLNEGTSCLLPASLSDYRLRPGPDPAVLIRTMG